MTKEEIINYVLQTPSNTNRNILEPMLDQLAGSGSSSSNILMVTATKNESEDWILDKTWQELFDADIAFVIMFGFGWQEESKEVCLIEKMTMDSGDYYVQAGDHDFYTDSADGYPTLGGDT